MLAKKQTTIQSNSNDKFRIKLHNDRHTLCQKLTKISKGINFTHYLNTGKFLPQKHNCQITNYI